VWRPGRSLGQRTHDDVPVGDQSDETVAHVRSSFGDRASRPLCHRCVSPTCARRTVRAANRARVATAPHTRRDEEHPTFPRASVRESQAPGGTSDEGDSVMIILGIILLILGLLLSVPVLWVIGIVLVVIGAVLWIAGSAGRAVGGRRHYY
jgi:hypothetical protein